MKKMGNPPGSSKPTYSRNVGSSSIQNAAQFELTGKKARKDRKVDPILDPKNSSRECNNVEGKKYTPIVVASDFTDSRGNDIEIIDQKIPMLLGQIIMKMYVLDPMISFAGLGDATTDLAPIQVGEFHDDDKLDKVLASMWIERGGGGTGQESYELMAYYYSYHTTLGCNREGEKGYFFFIGDEGFYPKVSKAEVKKIMGDDIPENLDSAAVFADLQEKFNVFFIYPKKLWEDRKRNIDKEIEQRVKKAGGMYDGVDIRISLMWNNRNDLDLHVITPSGFHIYFKAQKSPCGGFLDVDMNVHGETTTPVENVRWKKATAPKGKYRVFVRNYFFHGNGSETKATPFVVEVETNGQVQRFEKTALAQVTGSGSDVEILTFEYNPDERVFQNQDVYANYEDQVIKDQWAQVIPKKNILILENPKAIVDTILCALALHGGKTMDEYMGDMQEREQTPERQLEVRTACSGLADSVMPLARIEGNIPK